MYKSLAEQSLLVYMIKIIRRVHTYYIAATSCVPYDTATVANRSVHACDHFNKCPVLLKIQIKICISTVLWWTEISASTQSLASIHRRCVRLHSVTNPFCSFSLHPLSSWKACCSDLPVTMTMTTITTLLSTTRHHWRTAKPTTSRTGELTGTAGVSYWCVCWLLQIQFLKNQLLWKQKC